MAKRKRRPAVTKSKHGKPKTVAKKQGRAAASKVAKRSAKNKTKVLTSKGTRGRAAQKARSRKRKQVPAPAPQVETTIVDIVEERIPGMVTVTEIESVRVMVPDADTGSLPPEEGGMAA